VGKADQNEEIETSRPAGPDTVSAALAELTGGLREGLGTLAIVLGCRCWSRLWRPTSPRPAARVASMIRSGARPGTAPDGGG
jgi:hypothetical protein